MNRLALLAFAAFATLSSPGAESPATTNTALPRQDANGNPLRRAPTGHVSNYDESKVGNYTLPDPLVLNDGKPVRDADTWLKRRRPEILKAYETEIYGRIPERAAKMKVDFVEAGDIEVIPIGTPTTLRNGDVEIALQTNSAIHKELVGHMRDLDRPLVHVHLYLPTGTTKPVPVLLHMVFFSATPPSATPATTNTARPRFTETGPIADILARGFGYATFRYTEIEGDSRTGSVSIVRKLALAPGQTEPAPDEWGTITAWSWGASRVLDYFETDRALDAKHVAIIGHSRLGKTALWTGARDPRFALVFSSCAGEMGSALARRDFGETVDDMAANFPWQFAGNLQKYSGHWNNMPVDAHELIALNAPRPVFITGGTQDQWSDPAGEYLATVAAGPVYRLLGKQDLGTTNYPPPLDTPLISGDLGFHYHTGGHTITASDWKAFLDFADRHFKSAR